MTAPPRSPVARYAERLLQSTLFLWPEESREWGRAVVAEAAQVNAPIEALRWALGGLTFFLRSVGAHFLAWTKLPAGANSPSRLAGNDPPPLPKHSRITTAVLLVSAVVLLLLPWGREAVASVSNLWMTVGDFGPERRQVDALAKQADKDRDAQSLAFAAVTHPDSARGAQLASAAVALDPSLTWIFTSRFSRSLEVLRPPHWMEALESYDPKNGFPVLLAANDRAEAALMELTNRHTPSDSEVEQLLRSDAPWQELMRRAVLAPKYDDYSLLRRQLTRQTWARHPSLPPALAIFSMWSAPFPDIFALRSYAAIRVKQAQQLEARGDWQAAEESLNELRAFGERMARSELASIEQYGGVEVSRLSLTALRSLYATRQRSDELHAVDQALGQLQKRREALTHWDSQAYFTVIGRYKRPAIGVHLSSWLLVLGALAACLSLLFLEASALLPGLRNAGLTRLACFSADYAPVLLLCSAFGLLASFRPFAAAAAQFRTGGGAFSDDRYFPGIYFLLEPSLIGVGEHFPSAPYIFWWAVTLLLSFLVVLVTLRAFTRRRPA